MSVRRERAGGGRLAVAATLTAVAVMAALACAAAATTAESAVVGAAASRDTAQRSPRQALDVTFTVRERLGVARRLEPVTAGVPLARALGITSTSALRLLDATGRPVAVQFAVTARWGGRPDDPSLPIRWLLVDFRAGVPAGGAAVYRLVDGGGAVPGGGLSVVQGDAGRVEVSTGAARFVIDAARPGLLHSAVIGGQDLLRSGAAVRLVARDGAGLVYASGLADRVVVEEAGPVRATVRLEGWLEGPGGRLLHQATRLSFFAGSGSVRVLCTVMNQRMPLEIDGQPQAWDIGCPRSSVVADLTLRLDCAPGSHRSLLLGRGGRTTTLRSGAVRLYQDSSGLAAWDLYRGRNPRPQSYVRFRGYRVYRGDRVIAAGNQVQPWLDCSGSHGGVAVAVRDFWQNYPKALRGRPTSVAGAGYVEAALFPAEYAADFSLRPREQKTHELLLVFHGRRTTAARLRSRMAACAAPLFAAAAPAYYLSSGAFGTLPAIGDAAAAAPERAYEALNAATLDGSEASLPRAIDAAGFYSWQDYGEVPIDYENGGTGTLNHKYNFDYGMLLQYLRGGDERWLHLGEAAGRHIADLDVLHADGAPDVWWEGGFYGHSYHDESSDENPNRNHGGPHPDLVFGAPGLLLLYHLTGYCPALDTALEIADNVKYRFDNSFGRGNDQGYASAYDYENECESARTFANGLLVLVEAARATGDEGYLATAAWLIERSRLAVDPFIVTPTPGDRRFTKLFAWDLLELALGKYLDLCAELGRVDTSGARAQLLRMARQEADVMWKTDDRGNQGVPYAWMRDGTPWGWEDREVPVNVCNWHLLTADALAYAYRYGGGAGLLDKAGAAFKTGADPELDWYMPAYTATKEATNSANFGLVYLDTVQRLRRR